LEDEEFHGYFLFLIFSISENNLIKVLRQSEN